MHSASVDRLATTQKWTAAGELLLFHCIWRVQGRGDDSSPNRFWSCLQCSECHRETETSIGTLNVNGHAETDQSTDSCKAHRYVYYCIDLLDAPNVFPWHATSWTTLCPKVWQQPSPKILEIWKKKEFRCVVLIWCVFVFKCNLKSSCRFLGHAISTILPP